MAAHWAAIGGDALRGFGMQYRAWRPARCIQRREFRAIHTRGRCSDTQDVDDGNDPRGDVRHGHDCVQRASPGADAYADGRLRVCRHCHSSYAVFYRGRLVTEASATANATSRKSPAAMPARSVSRLKPTSAITHSRAAALLFLDQ